MAFLWNDIITNIAALSVPAVPGLTIRTTAPKNSAECKLPVLFPSRSPSVNLVEVARQGVGKNGVAFKIARYVLNYVYLKVQLGQGIDESQYETAVRADMAAIFTVIADNDTALGVEEVVPTGFSIAERVIDPNNQPYLGGLLTFEAQEYVNA